MICGMLWNEDLISFKQWRELRHSITTSNSLALGKPEPLAKNKQTDKSFYCEWAIGNEINKCEVQCVPCRNSDD